MLIKGPWEHRNVGANGARFHLAVAGSGPLVLFLHGYPQFWWTWRHQLTAVAGAGFRAAAMDLRGYGASDKPPDGYSLRNLAADVASVIRSLGESQAIVVGHGIGGIIAWSLPRLHPAQIIALCAISTPHPALLPGNRSIAGLSGLIHAGFLRHSAISKVTERRLSTDPGHVVALLRRWAAPGSQWPSKSECARYEQAMALPFTPHTAGAAYRWLVRAPLLPDGRRLLRTIAGPVSVPVLQLHGARDPLYDLARARRSAQFATGDFVSHSIPGAGHFPQEESPAAVTGHLLGWLASHRPANPARG